MIAVFDNFIKDQQLLDEIAAENTFFNDPGIYKYWRGWWTTAPKNVKQKLIQYIWQTELPIHISAEIHGFEYWTGVQSAENSNHYDHLVLHLDDDVNYREKTGNRMFPFLGCVYYPAGSEFEGGDLAIYTDGLEKTPELIKAKSNRLVIFNPGEVVHCVQTVTKGTRRAIAINLWEIEPWSLSRGFIVEE